MEVAIRTLVHDPDFANQQTTGNLHQKPPNAVCCTGILWVSRSDRNQNIILQSPGIKENNTRPNSDYTVTTGSPCCFRRATTCSLSSRQRRKNLASWSPHGFDCDSKFESPSSTQSSSHEASAAARNSVAATGSLGWEGSGPVAESVGFTPQTAQVTQLVHPLGSGGAPRSPLVSLLSGWCITPCPLGPWVSAFYSRSQSVRT